MPPKKTKSTQGQDLRQQRRSKRQSQLSNLTTSIGATPRLPATDPTPPQSENVLTTVSPECHMQSAATVTVAQLTAEELSVQAAQELAEAEAMYGSTDWSAEYDSTFGHYRTLGLGPFPVSLATAPPTHRNRRTPLANIQNLGIDQTRQDSQSISFSSPVQTTMPLSQIEQLHLPASSPFPTISRSQAIPRLSLEDRLQRDEQELINDAPYADQESPAPPIHRPLQTLTPSQNASLTLQDNVNGTVLAQRRRQFNCKDLAVEANKPPAKRPKHNVLQSDNNLVTVTTSTGLKGARKRADRPRLYHFNDTDKKPFIAEATVYYKALLCTEDPIADVTSETEMAEDALRMAYGVAASDIDSDDHEDNDFDAEDVDAMSDTDGNDRNWNTGLMGIRTLGSCMDKDARRSAVRLIRNSASNVRSELLSKVRHEVPAAYGFQDCAPTDAEKVQANQELYKLLNDPDKPLNCLFASIPKTVDDPPRSGPFQHIFIGKVIKAQFFHNRNAPGVIMTTTFNPMPWPLIALIYTLAQYCIDEWARGYHDKKTFIAQNHISVYKQITRYIQGCENNSVVKDLLMQHRKALYADARARSGAEPLVQESCNLEEVLAADIARIAADGLIASTAIASTRTGRL